MSYLDPITRRQWLTRAAVASAAVAGGAMGLTPGCAAAPESPAPAQSPAEALAKAGAPQKSRVVVIRHEAFGTSRDALAAGKVRAEDPPWRELLDEAAKTLGGDAKPADAWARWFKPADRISIKVNCLGYVTSPAMATSLAAALSACGVAPEQIILWDRTCHELQAAGYELRNSGAGPRCFGTDALAALRGNAGYAADVTTSGAIGSMYSRIVTDESTALISAPILKDHNIAGLSCGLKNFFGAIHNPNKYHENGCDPFVADVVAHPLIRDRLRLVVCGAMRPQYNGGPTVRPQWQWPYGGLLMATDPVALDRVALEIIARKRAAAGMPPLDAEKRPVRYLESAQARGLGTADLASIEVVSLGKPWMDVG